MEFHSSKLVTMNTVESEDCSVTANARLVEIFQRTAEGGQPYLFVEDEDGNPVGLLAAEDVLRRVTDPNPAELTKWMDMPAESALQSRIEMPENCLPFDESSSQTKVTRDGVLLGLVTEDDVLVSWKSIQKTLQNSQGDAVTGLPNRATFDQQLESEVNRARRCHHSVAVVLIDLDYFKPINDQFGHAAGDKALRTVARTLRETLRSYDLVARFGGDEFAVICSGCRPTEIDIVVRRLREGVLKLQDDPNTPRPLPTVSVGAAVAHDLWDLSSAADLVATADSALYAAKEAGRNCAYKVEMLDGKTGSDAEFVEDRYSHSAQPMAHAIQLQRYQPNAN